MLRIRIALGVALDKGIEVLASYHRTESLKNPKPVGFHGLRVPVIRVPARLMEGMLPTHPRGKHIEALSRFGTASLIQSLESLQRYRITAL